MTRTSLIAVAAAGFALAACTQPPGTPGSGSGGGNRTAAGAALGGILGGTLAGPATGGGTGRTVAGAAAGAAIGGAIGNRLDRQARELEQQLDDSVTVSNEGDQLRVNFPQAILFATDSATVSSSARSELRALARNLQNYPETNIQIIGHTDNTGPADYNFDLSNRRAGAVGAVLVDAGVSANRISATGRGEDQPVASNLSSEGRAQNRRVEVIIRPQQA